MMLSSLGRRPRRHGLGHAATLLLLALALLWECHARSDLEGGETAHPRGFLAAQQAEQRKSGAPPPPAAPEAGSQPLRQPQQQRQQQPQQQKQRQEPVCLAGSGPEVPWLLAAVALAAFAAGVAVGAGVQRQRPAGAAAEQLVPAGPVAAEQPKAAIPTTLPDSLEAAVPGTPPAGRVASPAASALSAAAPDGPASSQPQQQQKHGDDEAAAATQPPAESTAVPAAAAPSAAAGAALALQPPLPVASSGGGPEPLPRAADALAELTPEERDDYSLAAREVHALCVGLRIDYSRVSEDGKVQLALTMAHVLRNRQDRRHAESALRLGAEANELRGVAATAAEQTVGLHAARDARALAKERTAAIRATCADTLTFGLAVMLAAALHQGLAGGHLPGLAPSCGGVPAARWGVLWPVMAGRVAACYLGALLDVLIGLAVLFLTPWLVYRSGLLGGGGGGGAPVSRLLLGLGVACGGAGYVVVSKFGGDPGVWLTAWEAWVAAHLAFSCGAHRAARVSMRAVQAGAGSDVHSADLGWLTAAMWLLLGVALPLAAGSLPFWLLVST